MLPPIDTKHIQHSDNRISKTRANQQEGHATFFFLFGGGVRGRRLQARSCQLDFGFLKNIYKLEQQQVIKGRESETLKTKQKLPKGIVLPLVGAYGIAHKPIGLASCHMNKRSVQVHTKYI